MPNKSLKWIYLFVLSIIWGSSFILIKKGLVGLDPLQLGALRILFSATVLLLFGWKSLKKIKKQDWKWIGITGILGTGLPVFLFAFAETEIDSAVVGILNSSVPLLAFIFGILLFGAQFIQRQFIGVLLGLVGAGALIYIGAQINEGQNYWYASLVIIAASFYALNVNIIKRHLQEVPAIAIAAGNFVFLIIPAAIILAISGFFDLPVTTDATLQQSIGYIVILSIFGTALAKVMFNKLVQMSNPVFASSVTYLMPIISVMWGLLDGEAFTMLQFIATLIILVGVYIGNSARRKA
ncbi:DMT family transporter [Dokdonia donghaensis]|uniref:Permease n=1 Tax=Dokdonia donghaensis DSW-1 TaxID=1300343 RepID=A0A0A2GXP0_9FLAO|nr:EamA family transporter [Dokdonia donghaensis]ANH59764.1 putative inner membrane transporter YedA [Dokdonia donghaensis DSW-1]KGO07106.1 permease [Dokdonia donghaensis DSW-1]